MLLQLLTSGIHDLKVAIKIRMLGHLYPIENYTLQALNEGFYINDISYRELLLNYLESIKNRLLYSIHIIRKRFLLREQILNMNQCIV